MTINDLLNPMITESDGKRTAIGFLKSDWDKTSLLDGVDPHDMKLYVIVEEIKDEVCKS